MGGREVGGLANLLSAHRDLANPQHRAEVAALWGVPDVPAVPGKTAVEMFQAAADGEIKALWIACTNPAQSLPDQATVQRALQRAEFVVLQEAFEHTATAPYAHLLLPASSWGEKEGTVTNSERRISRVRAAVPPPGLARHDWQIALDFAQRLEARLRPGQPTLFPYDGPEAIWNEHRASTRGRDLDITGLSYPLLDSTGPQQWPLPAGATTGRTRLYEDGVFATPDGRARFVDTPFVPLAEPRDARFPFSLTTGRLRDQWHGMTRTGTLGRLFGHTPEPSDRLARTGHGTPAPGRRRPGARALAPRRAGAAGPQQRGRGAGAGLHRDALGPGGAGRRREPADHRRRLPAVAPTRAETRGGAPDARGAAVAAAGRGLAAARSRGRHAHGAARADAALRVRHRRAVRPAARRPAAARRRRQAPDASVLDAVEDALGLAAGDRNLLRYADPARGQRRVLQVQRGATGTLLQRVLLAGDAAAEAWVRGLLQDERPVDGLTRQLLSPFGPVQAAPRRRQVCNCLDVDEGAIVGALAGCEGDAPQRLAQLQQQLHCGTQCGSCLPELRRLVRVTPVPA